MQIIRHYNNVVPALQGAAFALGNFDGVHRGHRAVIGEAQRKASELGVPSAALVFEPHPRQFFFPSEPFFRLTPFRAKARLLERLGLDLLVALPFDEAMSKMIAADFVLNVLVDGLKATHVVAGYDFRFGRRRDGDAALLSYIGMMEGLGVSIVPEVRNEAGDAPYSSTLIRDLLGKGDPQGAARLLGHWWSVEGLVLSGDRRGRTIGFPTANLSLEEHVEPALGVYAVKVEIEQGSGKGLYNGVANVGRRPTFDKQDVVLEVHIFDFAGDIYGHHVAVSFIDFLRPEKKFSGLEELKAQIEKDSARARDVLATLPQLQTKLDLEF
jgi:riboflavin kinase/FMN adenylyltransferase